MKAYEIMMFLLIFNVVISIVGFLNIYNMGITGQDISILGNVRGQDAIWLFLGQNAFLLFTGLAVGGAVGYYLTRIPTTEGMAYGFFAALITAIFINTYRVLWAITSLFTDGAVKYMVELMVVLFLAICGILFAWGYLQLAKGGISGYV